MMTSDSRPGSVVSRLHLVLAGAGGLPLGDVDQIEVLIQAGEYLIAFENLCTQLDEYEIPLTPTELTLISELAVDLRADQRFYSRLADK
jgi:hypothetical protein